MTKHHDTFHFQWKSKINAPMGNNGNINIPNCDISGPKKLTTVYIKT